MECFESQERLCELINQAKEGLSNARKDHPGAPKNGRLIAVCINSTNTQLKQDMLAVDVSDTMCRDRMAQILDAAKPFVQAYVKHQSEFWLQLSWSCVHSFMPCISLLMFFLCASRVTDARIAAQKRDNIKQKGGKKTTEAAEEPQTDAAAAV